MKRYGMVIHIRPEKLDEYKAYHAKVWPEVLDMIKQCNIRNYSIYHKDGYLFSYLEYTGDDFDTTLRVYSIQAATQPKDFDADMAKMAAHPKTQEWWKIMKPMAVYEVNWLRASPLIKGVRGLLLRESPERSEQEPLDTRKDGEWWTEMEEVFHLD